MGCSCCCLSSFISVNFLGGFLFWFKEIKTANEIIYVQNICMLKIGRKSQFNKIYVKEYKN